MQVSVFPKEHTFSLHSVNSPVTCLAFFDNGTQLISGGADTHVILYDLVASSAEFKLMGHGEALVQVKTLMTRHPELGTPIKNLITASKDGVIKVWNMQQQCCIGTFSEASLTKITDFCVITELGLLITASGDASLKVFEIDASGNDGIQLKFNSEIAKDSE